jgi:hypothetical protein
VEIVIWIGASIIIALTIRLLWGIENKLQKIYEETAEFNMRLDSIGTAMALVASNRKQLRQDEAA